MSTLSCCFVAWVTGARSQRVNLAPSPRRPLEESPVDHNEIFIFIFSSHRRLYRCLYFNCRGVRVDTSISGDWKFGFSRPSEATRLAVAAGGCCEPNNAHHTTPAASPIAVFMHHPVVRVTAEWKLRAIWLVTLQTAVHTERSGSQSRASCIYSSFLP